MKGLITGEQLRQAEEQMGEMEELARCNFTVLYSRMHCSEESRGMFED